MVAGLMAVRQKLGRSFSGKFALTNWTNLKISLTMVVRVDFLTELALFGEVLSSGAPLEFWELPK